MGTFDGRTVIREYFDYYGPTNWGTPLYTHSTITDGAWKDVRTGANTTGTQWSVTATPRGRMETPSGTSNTPATALAAFIKGTSPVQGEVQTILSHANEGKPKTSVAHGAFCGYSGTGANWYEVVFQATSTTAGNFTLFRRTGTSFATSTVSQMQNAVVSIGTATTNSERLCVKLQLVSARVRAKIWLYGAAEPAAWTLDQAVQTGLTTFGHAGLIGRSMATTPQYAHFKNFFVRAYTSGAVPVNGDPTTPVVDDDTLGGYRSDYGWKTAISGHEWVGDAGDSAYEVYAGRLIGGGQVSRDATGATAERDGTAGNQQINGAIGPIRTDSLQMARFTIINAGPTFRLFHRGGTTISSGDYVPRTTAGQGIEVSVGTGSSALTIYWQGTAVKTYTLPDGPPIVNTQYYLKSQVRSGRIFAKFWSRFGSTEPPEWMINFALPATLNASGLNGVTMTLAPSVTVKMIEYHSTNVTENSFRDGDVTNALKSTMVATGVPGRIRRSTVSRTLKSTMSAVPQLGKKSEVTRQIKATASPAPARTRYNYIGSGYVGGILTKFNHVPNLNGKVAATIQPRRRRKSTVTRSLKGTLTVVPRRLYFVNTPSRALKMTAVGRSKIIITRTVSRSVKMTLIGAPVGYKTGATTRAIKFTRPSVASRKRVKSTVTREIISRMRIRFGPTVEDEANSTIHLGTSQSPSFVKFAGKTTDRLVSGTYFHGFVPRRVEGSVETGFELSKYAQGFIKTPQSASNIARVNMRTFPVRAKPAKVNASVSVGMYMDTSDFAWMYEDALEKRASMIHYACTEVVGDGIVITYRHKNPETLTSRTYFVAKMQDETPLLYGYSTNLWDQNTILVYLAEPTEDKITPLASFSPIASTSDGLVELPITKIGAVREEEVDGSKAWLVEEGTTNYILNPSFTDANGSATSDNWQGAINVQSNAGMDGEHSGVFNGTSAIGVAPPYMPVQSEGWATASAWMKGTGKIYMQMQMYNAAGGLVSTIQSGLMSLTNEWVRYTHSYQIPAGSSIATARLRIQSVGGSESYISRAQIEQKPYATSFTRGDMGEGHSWTGTAHASSSIRATSGITYPNSALGLSTDEGSVYTRFRPMPTDSTSNRYIFTSGIYMNATSDWVSLSAPKSVGSLRSIWTAGNQSHNNVGAAPDYFPQDNKTEWAYISWKDSSLVQQTQAGIKVTTIPFAKVGEFKQNFTMGAWNTDHPLNGYIIATIVFPRKLTTMELEYMNSLTDAQLANWTSYDVSDTSLIIEEIKRVV